MSRNASVDKEGEDEVALTAPRRFKSAFIFYSSERHKEIKEELAEQGMKEKTTNIAKMISKEWHQMTPEEREFWEEKSKDDQYRYNEEMMAFHESQTRSKPAKKDPDAPKRPMSAFLAFSNQRRASLKRSNPSMTNSDLSKTLSQIWKDAPPEIKQEYIDQEALLRAQYKVAMAAWRQSKKASSSSAVDPNLPDSEPTHTVRMLESAVVLPISSNVNVVDNSFLAQNPDRWNRPQHTASDNSFYFPTEPCLDNTQQDFWQSPQPKAMASTDQQNAESAELLELYKQPISNIHFDTEDDAGQHDEPDVFARHMGDL